MAMFEYRGRTTQGDLVQGRIEAESADAVASQLFNTGVTPIDIDEAALNGETLSRLWRRLGGGRPSADDLVLFTRQMHSVTKSGVPLVRGLLSLAESVRNEMLREALLDIVENLEAGRELSAGMARHTRVFDSLYVNIVKVGEDTGRMPEAFARLHQYITLDRETRKQIKRALRYPLIVMVALSGAIFGVTTWVIPRFAQIFESSKMELPVFTRIILTVSNFMQQWWPVVLIMIFATAFGFVLWKRTGPGRYRWDKAKLRIPVAGNIILRATLARFSRAFAMAYRSGVPMIQTMTLCARAVNNSFLGARILDMRNGVEKGESVSRTAITTGLFTPLVVQMMQVGEETGTLDEMLDEVAGFYEQEVDYDVKNLASLIEPAITILIGIMVLILALGVFLPMWDIVQLTKR